MLPNPQETADMITFTEEILNKKLHFLCSLRYCNIKCRGKRLARFCHITLRIIVKNCILTGVKNSFALGVVFNKRFLYSLIKNVNENIDTQ